MAVLSFFREYTFKDLFLGFWNGKEHKDDGISKKDALLILSLICFFVFSALMMLSINSLGSFSDYREQGNVTNNLRCDNMNDGSYGSRCYITYSNKIGFVDYLTWPINHDFNKNKIDINHAPLMIYNENDGGVYVEVESDKISSVTHKGFIKLSDLSKVFDAPDINSVVDTKMNYLSKGFRNVIGFSADKKPL